MPNCASKAQTTGTLQNYGKDKQINNERTKTKRLGREDKEIKG